MIRGSIIRQYVLSIWLAFSTLTSIGFGDYTPQSTSSRIVALGAAVSGLLFPVAVAWLARSQEERIEHYQSQKIFLLSEVEVFFPHKKVLPASLSRLLVKEIFLWLFGLRDNCFIGSYEDLSRLRTKLSFGLYLFTRVVPIAGAVSRQTTPLVKHSPVSTKKYTGIETNGVLVYDTLYLIKKRSLTKVILISIMLIMSMLLFFLVGGLGYYLCEEGANPLIAASPALGLADGTYLTVISVLTVGYGDIAPVTVIGKCWTIFTWSAFQYLIPCLLRSRIQHRKTPSNALVVHLLLSDEVVSRFEQMEQRRPGDYFLIPGHEWREIHQEMVWIKRIQYPLALVHGTIVIAVTP